VPTAPGAPWAAAAGEATLQLWAAARGLATSHPSTGTRAGAGYCLLGQAVLLEKSDSFYMD